MKKILLLFSLFTLLALSAPAQTQTGYVKTKGRLVNGKHVPGQGLTGATVHIKGRTSVLVKNSNGLFSFPVPANRFVVQSVRKNGYQLVDADAAPHTYVYSTAPIYLIMETPAQQMEDKLASERKLRRTLTAQLQKREDEIETLKEQNRITQEQYHNALQQLYDQQESNEKLVGEMAEYYSRIDYDQMDEFNRQVSELILAGELTRADSLLRSKGNIDERIRKLNRHHDANVEMRQMLEKSELAEQLTREDVARDCFNMYRRFVLGNEPDSALCYIDKRAGLDTANLQWQADAVSYLIKRGLPQLVAPYSGRVMNAARTLAGDADAEQRSLLAKTLNNMALSYSDSPTYSREATALFEEALTLFRGLARDDASAFAPHVASTLNNLAVHYSRIGNDYNKIETLLREALQTYDTLLAEDSMTYLPITASIWNNMALLLDETGRDGECEQAYSRSLDLYSQVKKETDAYDADYAAALNNLSAYYFSKGKNLFDSRNLLNEAIEIYRSLSELDAPKFAPMLAVALNNLSVQDFAFNKTVEGENAFNESLDIYRNLVGNTSSYYLAKLAGGLYEQAIRYYQHDDLEKSEALFAESLEAYRKLAAGNNTLFAPQEAKLLRNLANVYDKRQRWQEAGELYQEELAINTELARENPDEYTSHLARTYGNLSNHAILTRDFARAVDYARSGLELDDTRLFIQANLAAALLFMGETDQAQAIYTKYRKELRDTFLDDFTQFEALGIIPAGVMDAVNQIKKLLTNNK